MSEKELHTLFETNSVTSILKLGEANISATVQPYPIIGQMNDPAYIRFKDNADRYQSESSIKQIEERQQCCKGLMKKALNIVVIFRIPTYIRKRKDLYIQPVDFENQQAAPIE